MKKTFVIIMLLLLFTTGCNNKKFYLNDEYYKESKFIISNEDTIKDADGSYIIYVHNNYCSMKIPCETIFKSVMDKYDLSLYSIEFEYFKNTKYYKDVKYAPSIIIVNNGKIIDYLEAESDEDYSKYQDTSAFEDWLKKYIYLEKEDVK